MDPLGHVRQRVSQHERALQDRLRRDAVGDVDDLDLGRDPLHHAVAGAHEIVGDAEVREEGDREGHLASERSDGVDEPVEIVPLRLCDHADPASRAAAVVCGPIETAGMPAPSAPKARAAEAEARTTTSPAGGAGRSSVVR